MNAGDGYFKRVGREGMMQESRGGLHIKFSFLFLAYINLFNFVNKEHFWNL